MKRAALVGVGLALVSLAGAVGAQRSAAPGAPAASAYFPDRLDWLHKRPDEVGMSPTLLDQAVRTAVASETPAPKDMTALLMGSFAGEPFDTIIGPIRDRGPASGLITRHGYIVAEWGEPMRVDITNSVTKTFLTTVIGLAWQRGLIRDTNDYVRDYMPPDVTLFDAPHNRQIRWEHMLRQTSDWQGTLWGKPDWGDRPEGDNPAAWQQRTLWEPGTHYKYNDVRVNAMALAALQVWRRPLPEVLRENIMDPIGASSTWRWYGYENSWVELDGQRMQSVSGGGHWGGGMFINAYDMARFGYLFLRNGKWKDRELVSEKWIEKARTPGPANAEYGYANWYLNTNRTPLPAAPESAVYFVGNGANVIYVDWEHDIVAVMRWVRGGSALNDIVGRMLAAVTTQPAGQTPR
jgi:CubicO group peptidase (beta-lactamase class C family)